MFTYHDHTCMYGFTILVIWIPVHITVLLSHVIPVFLLYACFPVTEIVISVTAYVFPLLILLFPLLDI